MSKFYRPFEPVRSRRKRIEMIYISKMVPLPELGNGLT